MFSKEVIFGFIGTVIAVAVGIGLYSFIGPKAESAIKKVTG